MQSSSSSSNRVVSSSAKTSMHRSIRGLPRAVVETWHTYICPPPTCLHSREGRSTHAPTSPLAPSCRFLVFFMQVGFIALETGSGRAKNVRNILLKNLLDTMLTALCWWAVGYAFAYGSSAGGVIG